MRFGKKKARAIQCDYCGRRLTPLRSLDVKEADFHEVFTQQVGMRCTSCGKTACQPCICIAAKARGAQDFICPACGTYFTDFSDRGYL